MKKIKFGTDGWRAIIAKDFTTGNVARIAEGTALWALKQDDSPTIMLGHDCRFGGELFTETVAKVLTRHGIKVFMAGSFVTAPMISMGTRDTGSVLGVFITASHNPPLYNGYKLKGHYGGPLLEEQVLEVEALIPDRYTEDPDQVRLDTLQKEGLLEYIDLESAYCEYLEQRFDLDAIRNSGMGFAFDAMYGSGQNVMRRLFPDIMLLHCERQPLFDGIPPEPLARNLKAFSEAIRLNGRIDCGLAVDGDADRTALMDNRGRYIDSHHVILLLIQYLHHYKKKTGKVATGFSSSVKIHKLCEIYGIPLEVVKIGFKHICGIMLEEEVLVGGEESGGIAVSGHIPERDGIYNGLIIWEAMVKTGKTLTELIDEIYTLTGSFAFERSDLTISKEDKERITDNCKHDKYRRFGKYIVQKQETLDGFKYYFSDSQWLMIRPSGTEPVLRTYAEGKDRDEALDILKAGYETIMNPNH
ncbi:MAG: phosphoglucomutase/phosphomannomutase family protein [Bacteroidia bacterium]|nr:MAG: phosphoglucomutase/phosphomannomutase family protein [Bacteroidia bacterium]